MELLDGRLGNFDIKAFTAFKSFDETITECSVLIYGFK